MEALSPDIFSEINSKKNKIIKDLPCTSFGGSIEQFIDDIYCKTVYTNGEVSTPILKAFNQQLFKYFVPDINGYTLAFLVPPPFIGLYDHYNLISEHNNLTLEYRTPYLLSFQKLIPFAAIEFSPPQRSVNTERITARSGGVPYATEVEPSEQCSVSYLDNFDLDIFNFHCEWIAYIEELLDGRREPPSMYLNYKDPNAYGGLDYSGTLYIVKYAPSLKTIKYIGKCTGIFPQSLPSKSLIGSRQQNDITVLEFNYFCAYFEESVNQHHPIWNEFQLDITPLFN